MFSRRRRKKPRRSSSRAGSASSAVAASAPVTNRSCQSRATAIGDDISVSEPEFRVERADAPAARALLDDYLVDLRARLGEFDEARGAPAGADEMAPPAGVFLVGYLEGEAVACGGLKPRP